MKQQLHQVIRFKNGSEIYDIFAIEVHQAVLGSTVDLYYRSSRDGKVHVQSWSVADAPAAIRAAINSLN